ncbi:MAG: hypothetical protein WDO15_13955 [Bacteroidota bacterium]
MKENIHPLAFVFHPSDNAFSFKFEADQAKATIAALEDAWKKIGPGQPFSYTFLDEEFGKMYSAEQRLGKIFELFSGLAIVIACIGLFALTAFTAEQRTKEIGIRKVLGGLGARYRRPVVERVRKADPHLVRDRVARCMVRSYMVAHEL